MDTNEEYYSKHGMREGDPGNINPNNEDFVAPSKNVSEIEKLEINQSGSGVLDSRKQSEEYISDPVSQIDEGTKKLKGENASKQAAAKQSDPDDAQRTDDRDRNDSTNDWNAEGNNTGRHR